MFILQKQLNTVEAAYFNHFGKHKTNKQTNRQTDKQTNRQTDKQTDRQTYFGKEEN